LPSGRIATSTTVDGRGAGIVVDGEIGTVVVVGAVVVVVSSRGRDVVVDRGRVVPGVPGPVDGEVGGPEFGGAAVGTGGGGTAPGAATSPGIVVVDSGGRGSPCPVPAPRFAADTSTPGLSFGPAQAVAESATTTAMTRFRFTSRSFGRSGR
jgi:hypothetical protein